jgi:uncharacterized membrane protein YjgN (DUF898 family)
MENTVDTNENTYKAPHHFKFFGETSKYYGIVIINYLLTVVTLGLYYPWAKTSKLKYLYENTEFAGSRFMFHGTGKEVFKGFIKMFVVVVLVLAVYMYLIYMQQVALGLIIYFTCFIVIIPLAIHGSLRYRLSRTSWRGIHFGYRGVLSELFSKYVIGFVLTILTLGIYGSWFTVDIRKYVLSKIRFGSAQFDYTGEGMELFIINLKGIILSVLTLNIYSFWYMKNLYNYYINNIVVYHDEEWHRLESKVNGGDFFGLFVVNFILILVSFGLAYPYTQIRTMRFLSKNLFLEGSFNVSTLVQTEENYNDASGDDLADWLDIDLV